MEYYPYGSVRQYMCNHKLKVEYIRDIISCVLLGLDHVHSKGIAHRVVAVDAFDGLGHKAGQFAIHE